MLLVDGEADIAAKVLCASAPHPAGPPRPDHTPLMGYQTMHYELTGRDGRAE